MGITRQHRQSYRHADPRRQQPQVAQRRIGMRNTGHGHYQPCDRDEIVEIVDSSARENANRPIAGTDGDNCVQDSHASWKVLEFFSPKFKALKVLEKRTGA